MSCHKGRHRKPSRVKALTTPGVTAAAITGGIIFSSPGMASAHTVPDPAPSPSDNPGLTSITSLIQRYIPRHAASETLLVKSGDTLGSISAQACGTPDDWTGIYKKNKKVIGENPDLILPGQHLVRNCQDVPVPRPPKIVVTANVQSQGRHARITGGDYHPSGGTFSFAGLERLWVAAGGDSWAESAAASVAECESGGRSNAYNPSGATGLWQILGAVRPGSLYDPMTNARNAVAKFNASGKSWAQWVCKP